MERYALNHDRLTPRAAKAAREVGLEPVVRNPFRSVLVRAVETVYACEEALRIMDRYRMPETAWVEPPAIDHPVHGAAATEAPRGMLYHSYDIDPQGLIQSARIIAPTSQNQKRIEDDVRHLVQRSLDLDTPALTFACERTIRNHDPCISCATHFLTLDLVRE
jgi:coenzyme F420-reducing hydrogenase alpha subunit